MNLHGKPLPVQPVESGGSHRIRFGSADQVAASQATPGKHHPVFGTCWHILTVLTVASALFLLYSIGWEISTRRYLRGFSDAIVPATAPPEEKIESILSWMAHGPARLTDEPSGFAVNRDPTDTLNYDALLRVCGTATNAFINLANSAGLSTRRLLILDQNRSAKHVTVEVLVRDRWIMVDPAYRTVFRGANGATLTREELASPDVFAVATAKIRNYNSDYTFDQTAHIRIERFWGIGRFLRSTLDRTFPAWDESSELTLLVERKSLAFVAASLVLLLFLLISRAAIRWWAEARLQVRTPRVREQVYRAAKAFLNIA